MTSFEEKFWRKGSVLIQANTSKFLFTNENYGRRLEEVLKCLQRSFFKKFLTDLIYWFVFGTILYLLPFWEKEYVVSTDYPVFRRLPNPGNHSLGNEWGQKNRKELNLGTFVLPETEKKQQWEIHNAHSCCILTLSDIRLILRHLMLRGLSFVCIYES